MINPLNDPWNFANNNIISSQNLLQQMNSIMSIQIFKNRNDVCGVIFYERKSIEIVDLFYLK